VIDPILSLTFSIHSNKGVYALLIGSGVSRAARVPTGWEVVLDLIRKLAHVQGSDCGNDPAAWYRTTFSEAPDYSRLLDHLGKSQSDRSQLLRPYFEPTEEERAQGLKRPTAAHRAIARLMAGGFIRVVVTTNFDRLLEQALQDLGIEPAVISTPEAAAGSRPLIHSRHTILKVHGDYLDDRMKNTLAELEVYDPQIDALLDRILDEFGIVVCGWSADWDAALLRAFMRSKNHRFPMYWTTLREPSDRAKQLTEHRRAQVLTVKSADAFFSELAEKVAALGELDRPHPLSAKVAVETLKSYLVKERDRIRLADLVTAERENVHAKKSQAQFSTSGPAITPAEYRRRIQQYEAITEVLMAMVAAGCYWGEQRHEHLWTKCIDRLASDEYSGGFDVWVELRKYPALLLFYSGGLAALAGGKNSAFVSLATNTRVKRGDKEYAAYEALNSWGFEDGAAQFLPSLQPSSNGQYRFPVSEHLHNILREPLRNYMFDDKGFDLLFDRFEYLTALAYFVHDRTGAPLGRFAWRTHKLDKPVQALIAEELVRQGNKWPLFEEGLFKVSWKEFLALKEELDAKIAKMR